MALYRCPVYSQLFLISGEGFSLSNFFFASVLFFSFFFVFVLPKSKFYYSHIGDTLFIIVHLRATQQQKHLLQFRVLSTLCVSPTEFRISKKKRVFSKVKNWAREWKRSKWCGAHHLLDGRLLNCDYFIAFFTGSTLWTSQFSNTSYYY